jgi:hypothetical protein
VWDAGESRDTATTVEADRPIDAVRQVVESEYSCGDRRGEGVILVSEVDSIEVRRYQCSPEAEVVIKRLYDPWVET